MEILDYYAAAAHLAKLLNKWTIATSLNTYDNVPYEEYAKAAPYLDNVEAYQVIADGCGIIICDSEEECEKLFDLTVGDDGPTKTNPYNGPARVYALTISPNGEFINENT
jgi:hypothetical protein